MKKLKVLASILMLVVLFTCMTTTAFATGTSDDDEDTLSSSFDDVVDPVVELLNSLLKPMLAIVVAVGSLYCVVLGIKYSKAEEPQDREKAKQHLKNAIIGFFLIFILILALNILKQPLIDWVNKNAGGTTNVIS